MRNYLVGASIAVASYALDIEETLKEHVLNQKQGNEAEQPNGWPAGSFS